MPYTVSKWQALAETSQQDLRLLHNNQPWQRKSLSHRHQPPMKRAQKMKHRIQRRLVVFRAFLKNQNQSASATASFVALAVAVAGGEE